MGERDVEEETNVATSPSPKKPKGDSSPSNLSLVPDKKHQAWHLLFSNHTVHVIANIINQTWIDSNFELIVRRKNEILTTFQWRVSGAFRASRSGKAD